MSFEQLQPGQVISLGRYPQGANGEVQPIEWQVLEVEDDRALLLSRHVLDCAPYHSEQTVVRWENSRLRQWLLEDFMSAAFSEGDLAHICRPEAANDPAGELLWQMFGMETTTGTISDPVFLLAQADILRLFPGGDNMFCPGAGAAMTPWVAANHPDMDEMNGHVSWWLRSSFNSMPFACIVSPVESNGVSGISPYTAQGVRPAVWVRLNTPAT